MRYFIIVLPILMLSTFLIAQQKYLVSPSQELIPISKYDNVPNIIAERTKNTSSTSGECGNKFSFGYHVEDFVYNINWAFNAYQKDVVGTWFDAKASGTIDTIYWYGQGTNCAKDSLVFLRIHESIIGPNYGPGRGIHWNAPPCQSWGYWKNSLDLERGVAAFPDDATDTIWYSTINPNGGVFDPLQPVPPTRPPFGYSKWGALGFGKVHLGGVNAVAMMDAGEPCSVKIGEIFFVSFRINSGPYSENYGTGTATSFKEWDSAPTKFTTNDEMWPSRVWKFYEHDSGPSNCAGMSVFDVKRGWVARGPAAGSGLNLDSVMLTSMLNVWYVMTVTTNVPPSLQQVEGGDPGVTFNTVGPYVIQYDIWDCDPGEPTNAAVASAEIRWSKGTIKDRGITYEDQTPITMTNVGGDLWEGEIPGQPANTIVSYRVYAIDNKGMETISPLQYFRVYGLKQQYYLVDTGTCGTMYTIKGLGSTTEIPFTAFFADPRGNQAPRDDGTAGPFDIGGDMPIFGDVGRYAWVGVNGAIALSKGQFDTIDVNSNGYYNGGWIFPYSQHHNRADTLHPSWMPPNFIAPFWSDFIIADLGSPPTTYGHIFYGNANDPCKFIVEWDSIGSFNQGLGTGETDATLFRIVLNRCDGTIEYQYTGVGSRGQDSAALIGLQADSSALSGPEPGWIFINYNAAPYETKPRPNFCIKFSPGAAVFAQSGWNLLSVANDRPGDMAKTSVYPDAISDAFAYEGSYVQKPTLVNGVGYWLKYDKYTYAGGPGYPKNSVTAIVAPGWNMIGSITAAVPTAGIVKTPGGMATSDYFKYEGGYQTVTTLTPGLGFWVKTDQAGTLDLLVPESMPKDVATDYSQMNRITVIDRLGRQQKLYVGEERIVKAQSMYTGEMPPPAPEFDARFANTGSMTVTYPAFLQGMLEYFISVTTDAYPISVKWEVVKPMVLYAGGRMVSIMEGNGMVQLKSAAGLAVGIGSGVSVPKVFALSQNYPNPFNPVTRFMVDVPKLAEVQIAIYNVLGQKVKTLLSGETSPGSYEMEWDGTDGQGVSVPTGIYFIRMTANEFKATQKIMLMK